MTTTEDRHYAMGVLAAKGAMRDGNAFADMCNQAEEVLAKETVEAKAERLHTALVTVKVNGRRGGFTPALETYIDEQLKQ